MSALDHEMEGEWESEAEAEAEAESEEFFRQLAGLARRAVASPALRRVGLAAARGALSGLGGVGNQLSSLLPQSELAGEGEWEGEGELEWELEAEGEWEGEGEAEWEVNPIRRIYPDALMEHLGHEAAHAENEEEAEAFVGALVPLAARLAPKVAPAILRAAPQLIRGVAGAARSLRANPATRPLVRALPTVVRRTAASLAHQAQRGRRVTPTTAVRTLAHQTAQVLGNPRRSVQAYHRSRALDHRFHRGTGTCGTCAAKTALAAGAPAAAGNATRAAVAAGVRHAATPAHRAVRPPGVATRRPATAAGAAGAAGAAVAAAHRAVAPGTVPPRRAAVAGVPVAATNVCAACRQCLCGGGVQ